MKKISLILATVFAVSIYASATPVSETDAEKIARIFFFGDYATKINGNDLSLAWDGKSLTVDTKSEYSDDSEFLYPPFYAFNRYGGGFVFVSGDDSVDPIIGYSFEGTVDPDNMPPALKWWLEGVAVNIYSQRLDGQIASYETKFKWNHPETKADTGNGSYYASVGGKQLNTPQWYQNDPFNKQVPVKSKNQQEHCPCGCVATAIAELMKFYKWPDSPEPLTIPGYDEEGAQPHTIESRNLEGRTYDFSDEGMPMYTYSYYNNAYNETVGNNVATLLADIGCAVQMDYDDDGSGASSEGIVYAAGKYFKYNKAAKIKYAANYGIDQWLDMLVASIDDGHPLLTAGTSSTGGGHQFLIDGYDSNHLMRFNFGWGNYTRHDIVYQYNGYWALGMSQYAIKMSSIFDFYPDKENISQYNETELILKSYDYAQDYGIILPDCSDLEPNTGYEFVLSYILNTGPTTFNGTYRLAYKTRNGGDFYTLGKSTNTSLSTGYLHSFSKFGCNTPKMINVKLGDCVVFQYNRNTDDPDVWHNVDSCQDGSCVTEYPAVASAFIDLPSSCSKNDYFDLKLKNAPYCWSGRITWSLTDPSGKVPYNITVPVRGASNYRASCSFTEKGRYKVKAVVHDIEGNVIDNISTFITVN